MCTLLFHSSTEFSSSETKQRDGIYEFAILELAHLQEREGPWIHVALWLRGLWLGKGPAEASVGYSMVHSYVHEVIPCQFYRSRVGENLMAKS